MGENGHLIANARRKSIKMKRNTSKKQEIWRNEIGMYSCIDDHWLWKERRKKAAICSDKLGDGGGGEGEEGERKRELRMRGKENFDDLNFIFTLLCDIGDMRWATTSSGNNCNSWTQFVEWGSCVKSASSSRLIINNYYQQFQFSFKEILLCCFGYTQ